MKNQRHKRKRSFSVLLISNTDGSSRQFHISLFSVRLLVLLLLIVFVSLGWFAWQFSSRENQDETLLAQITALEQENQQLTAEKETLNAENLTLITANESLRQEAEQRAEEMEEEETEAEDPSLPSRYPSYGAGIIKSDFSEEQPYLSIETYSGGSILAAGDGTVTAVSSDDIYAHIIEIEHASGYRTRYLCHQEAEVTTEEGAQVQGGDTLLNITADDTIVDYQIIYEEAPIDPMSVIDAKG